MTIRQLVEELVNSAGGNLEKRVILSARVDVCLDAEKDKWEMQDFNLDSFIVKSKHPCYVDIIATE